MAAQSPESTDQQQAPQEDVQKDSYVKLAMRNMVKKSSKSIFHFGLTAIGLLGVLIGLAYLTR